MTELLTADQMRHLEQAAIESGNVSGLELMERAGHGVVDAVMTRWPDFTEKPHRALVLCGPGNNGGDGFVIARLLAEKGWAVDVFLFGEAAKLPPDARANHDRWASENVVGAWDVEAIASTPRPDLILDAVFGIGLTRPLPDDVMAVLGQKFLSRWRTGSEILKVAVDCPSGLNLDTGHIPFAGDATDPASTAWPTDINRADLTVAFHAPKPGHYLAMGPTLCGALRIADIGLRGDARERASVMGPPDTERARLIEPVFMDQPVPRWPMGHVGKANIGGHKYDHGHVLVFAGGAGRGGAARLAARMALRAGAGLVTVVCPPEALAENAAALDAVMLRDLPLDARFSAVADDRVTGLCLGPGMGVTQTTRTRVLEALSLRADERRRRDPVVVLDADALTVFAGAPGALFEACHSRTILTPHEGEFARLFPDLAQSERANLSKIDVVRSAAARAGCVVLLKGEDTVIAEPGGGASVHAASYDRAAPWLATAGAGDVLAGLIAGLAASDLSGELINMAEVAVWLHVEAARSFGPGLIAEDLPDALPKVLREL